MTYFYQWTKQIVFFYILMMAILHLLPKKSYQKYLRFFGGLVLAVLLLRPFLTVLGREDAFFDRISYESFWQEMDTAALDLKELEQWQQETYLAEYERAIAGDIAGLAPEEFTVEEVKVTLTEETAIESVELYLTVPWENRSLSGQLPGADNSGDYPGLGKLKERLMEFYRLSGEQIRIYVS